MKNREGKPNTLTPAWWIAYGVLCGLGAAGLILLLASPRRGQPIALVAAPTRPTLVVIEESLIELTPTASPEPTVAFPIDINTATASEFEQLPGIGPTLALSIVAYRENHGLFQTVAQIQNVPDIGPKTYEAILPFITVSQP